jgi:superoxide reductase
MARNLEIYKCEECGNIVEVLHEGPGALYCCGQPMKVYIANTTDAAKEKHVPVIEKTDSGITVQVGSVPHPMEAKHYIEWIELIVDGRVCRKTLAPGDEPKACFAATGDKFTVRAYCNLHGLWKA